MPDPKSPVGVGMPGPRSHLGGGVCLGVGMGGGKYTGGGGRLTMGVGWQVSSTHPTKMLSYLI